MLTYIIRRLLLMIPTLLGITLVVCFVMALAPGGIAPQLDNLDESGVDAEQAQALRVSVEQTYGLDLDAPMQYVRWLNGLSPLGFYWNDKDRQLELVEAKVQIALRDEAAAAEESTDDSAGAGTSESEESQTQTAQTTASTETASETESGNEPQTQQTQPVSAEAGNETAQAAPSPSDEPSIEELRAMVESDYGLGFGDTFGFKWPDFGRSVSFDSRPVLDVIAQRLPITILLNLLAIPIIYAVAITVGIYAARHRGQLIDVGTGTVMLALWSIPTMWSGVLLIVYFTGDSSLLGEWAFPSATAERVPVEMQNAPFLPFTDASGNWQPGYLLSFVAGLILPVLCLTYAGFAVLSKLTRSAMLENILSDFARTARAKGCSERSILWSHVFRNSLLPLITVASTLLPSLLAGSVIVERIFSIDGMGNLAITAVNDKDRDLVLAITTISGVLTLVGYLLADLAYAIADPRVSYE